ncbi:flagellar hook protein FlgE [Desulfonauticus submarinus]|uniref:Flagellar hook protein FlgE n=1 Tax=Desulfonauticus submarinus TaxID=206665 RepID=A0A1H0CQJ9_9BACT|nr:flagellar hook protein FlgE [Desulfonauticus submarinus]SDN60041.1 flagellar hook protein FlgE [Desulfonauticus submarinus]
MGLTAALYSGTSGLKVHGEGMSVVGNNIANVSTVGFKASRMHFEDALSQEITVANGVGQVGRGVAVGAVYGDFTQGSLETTTESTDLAIGGNGFFIVSPKGEEIEYYTRAGNFRFDQEGYLVDPHGYVVQGWQVQQEDSSAPASGSATTADQSTGVRTVGTPTDIRLENFQSPPEATSRVDMVVNLDSRSEDHATDATNPFFAMFNNWDASQDTPLGDAQYAYQSTIKVYDENGTSHNLTVYFDPVSDDISNTGGRRYWEYMVTVNPDEDNRTFWSGAANTTKKGVLMIGSLTFNSAGEIENLSAFTLSNVAAGDDPSNLSEWTPADFSQNGYPLFTANFLGNTNADYTSSTDATNIELNFGLRNRDLTETPAGSEAGWDTAGGTADATDNASLIGTNLNNLNVFQDPERSALAITNYSTGSTTIYQSQDGYTAGFLQNITVDRDGVITGRYSNGQILQLYALTLADFNNKYGLRREGGNLFAETRSSGPPLTGLAGTGGKGTIASNSLEQSNVDLATEFVKMITIEKGFQANSKTITTTDGMLSVLIQIKR